MFTVMGAVCIRWRIRIPADTRAGPGLLSPLRGFEIGLTIVPTVETVGQCDRPVGRTGRCKRTGAKSRRPQGDREYAQRLIVGEPGPRTKASPVRDERGKSAHGGYTPPPYPDRTPVHRAPDTRSRMHEFAQIRVHGLYSRRGWGYMWAGSRGAPTTLWYGLKEVSYEPASVPVCGCRFHSCRVVRVCGPGGEPAGHDAAGGAAHQRRGVRGQDEGRVDRPDGRRRLGSTHGVPATRASSCPRTRCPSGSRS